jgi:hypothetical protein
VEPNGEPKVEAFAEPEEKGDGDGAFETNVDVGRVADGTGETPTASSGLGTLYLAASFLNISTS